MTRSLDSILTEINATLAATYTTAVFRELAVLSEDGTGQTFPMYRTGIETGAQISPEDNANGFTFYHRELNPVNVEPIEGAKGMNSYQLAVYSMRLVGVAARANVTGNTDEMNNVDFARDVMAVLGANAVLSQREIVQVSGQVNALKKSVLQTEYANNPTIIGDELRLLAFSIDYQIRQKQICTVASGVGTPVTALLLTQAEYDALTFCNPNIYYLISG